MNVPDRWIIYYNSEYINTILASEEYVKQFCKKNNYTYKKDELLAIENPDPISALQQENKLLKAQLKAQTDRADFIEDCLAEMAGVVYNTEETTT